MAIQAVEARSKASAMQAMHFARIFSGRGTARRLSVGVSIVQYPIAEAISSSERVCRAHARRFVVWRIVMGGNSNAGGAKQREVYLRNVEMDWGRHLVDVLRVYAHAIMTHCVTNRNKIGGRVAV